MKIFIIMLIICLIPNIALAKHKLFYDSASKMEITDVSGKKTKAEIVDYIKKNHGIDTDVINIQEITVNEKAEHARIVDGKLTRYNFIKENDQIRIQQKLERQKKINAIKAKLGLSDEDLENLKAALK